jgi:hypothetical protein
MESGSEFAFAMSRWVVCGYSLPLYDVALRAFFEEILSKQNQALILRLSPESPALVKHWREICLKSTQVLRFRGFRSFRLCRNEYAVTPLGRVYSQFSEKEKLSCAIPRCCFSH